MGGVLTIGVDVGGTKTAAGVVDEGGRVLETRGLPTPSRDTAGTEAAIVALVSDLRERYVVEAVGIGAAGYIDAARSTVLFAPNLAWRDEPLQQAVEAGVGIPVVVENDANAAAWGEYRFGAGVGVDEQLMVTVGTGIGGGIVYGGALVRGGFGIAGEFGHVRVVPNGHVCGCGNHGCWEQYASGSALVRYVREVAATHSPQAAEILDVAGGDPEAISGLMITAAAEAGDRLCVEAFNEIGRWLGEGIADLASFFDPALVVVGGGVSEAGDLLLDPTREAFRRQLTGRGHRPELEIKRAALGNKAGMTGAADLARHR